ncbi:MAG: YgaP family membrane protein [Thermocrinis sp.]
MKIYLENWFWKFFLLFMSLNQIQSAFTNWCPVITLYKKLGIKECA